MARLPYLDREDLPESERDIFDDMMERFGRIHHLHRAIAHSPVLLRALLHWGEAIRRSTRLDPILRELAILTVGRLTQCEYEYVHHQGIAKRVGVRQEQLDRLEAWENDAAFTEQERAVIRYATEATQYVRVSDATFEALRRFLDAEQLVQLVLVVGHFNMVVRILLPLEIELESDAHISRYNLDRAEQQSS
jgi:AhpD family alkylhydroperoxidase